MELVYNCFQCHNSVRNFVLVVEAHLCTLNDILEIPGANLVWPTLKNRRVWYAHLRCATEAPNQMCFQSKGITDAGMSAYEERCLESEFCSGSSNEMWKVLKIRFFLVYCLSEIFGVFSILALCFWGYLWVFCSCVFSRMLDSSRLKR